MTVAGMLMRRVGSAWPILVVILAYILLAAPLLKTPLRWDEIEWPPQAEAILERGVPKVLFSEAPYIYHPEAWLIPYGADYGLWHPPLYLYCLALFIGLFGNTILAARSLGLVCGVLTLLAVILGVRHIARRDGLSERSAGKAAFMSGAIIAINPFYVHGTLLLDIDNTVLMFLAVLYFFLLALSENLLSWKRRFFLTLITILLFWSKLAIPVMAFSAAAFYCVLRKNWQTLVRLCAIMGISIILFITTWFIYASVFRIPPTFFMDFTYMGRVGEFFRPNLFAAVSATRFNVVMISFPLVALAAMAFVSRIRPATADYEAVFAEDVFWIMGIALFLFHSFLWTNFGKYTVMLIPILAVPISLYVARIFDLEGGGHPARLFIAAAAALAVYYWLVVPDVIIGPHRIASVNSLGSSLNDPRLPRYALSVLPILLALCAFFLRRNKYGMTRSCLILFLLAALVVSNIIQNIFIYPVCRHSHILTPSVTRGFIDTVRYINREISASDKLLAPKEFAYYLKKGKVIAVDREIAYPDRFLPGIFSGGSDLPEYAIFCSPSTILDLPGFRTRYEVAYESDIYKVWKRSAL